MENIILIGGGGHCKSVINSIKSKGEFNIVGILDKSEKIGMYISNIKIIGDDFLAQEIFSEECKYAFITLGSIGDTAKRENLYKYIKSIGFIFPNIIDNTAIVSDDSTISEGVFIGKGSIVNSGVRIGRNVIVNTGSILEHDVEISDFVHVATRSVVCGDSKVLSGSHIGAGVVIIQSIMIGERTIIGAGSVVTKDVGSYKKAYGNPCREVGINE